MLCAPDHANAGMRARTVSPVQAGLIDEAAITAALHPSVKVSDVDLIVNKPQFGAFSGTDVEVILGREASRLSLSVASRQHML